MWGETATMGDIIGYLVVGVIAGWLAGVITRTDRGILGDLVLGILGALAFGFVFNAIDDNFILEVISATIGAVVLVIIKNFVMSRAR
jgi:uncharacterized membrane protein YeaQ/YmgE (transglycosylase-associated protein family)